MSWDVVAAEAAKTVTAGVGGVVVAGAGEVMRALLRRLGALPDDPKKLRDAILAAGERDPQFAAEVSVALAAVAGAVTESGVLPPTVFHDRDTARAELAEPGAHLVAGVHGAGKTALVLQVSQEAAEGFPGGRAYVDLDVFRVGEALQVGEVQAAVLRQFGVPVAEVSPAMMAEQYLRALWRRRCILVLDNVLGAAELSALVQPWPASLVLVTARQLTDDLRAWGPAAPGARGPAAPVILHGLDEQGAWAMLEHRCPGMLAAEPTAARELLELCDRIPFAIEQVAVRLSRRRGAPGAVAAVRDELATSDDPGELILRCLTQTMRELPDATVDDLIVLAAQPVRDFSHEAAASTVGHGVDRLIDAGLVAADARGRLRLPGLIRDHALRMRSGRPVDADTPFDRLLTFYRDRAVAADLKAGGQRLRRYQVPSGLVWNPSWPAPLDWLETELPAIVAVIPRAVHAGRFVEVTQLCGALEPLLTSRGHHWRIAGANEWGVRAAQALGNQVLEARIHAAQARLFTQLHLLDRAENALTDAERLLAASDDAHLRSSVTEFRGRLAEARGDYGAAEQAFRLCLAIDERHQLHRSAGIHHRMLANVLVHLGRPQEALPLLTVAFTLTDDVRNAGRTHTVAARAHLALGDLARAHAEIGLARQRVAEATATQYEVELADIEAELAWRSGDPEAARARWGWIAQGYWNAGDPRFDRYLGKLNVLPPPPG
ncbi:NB-ARC domain-containing protein [Micromonospora sp. WMMD1082]|uniref:NB-ARC domain-containing protein n=1 Tax=Micromonospora sp. WMMD1082 TaxID=3016104 RepID=UPI0024178C34|nr:NB-ARC domain-containing protein [Micromonospora sp. WMMD1082]MDG4798424.1 NB-ARC domain-containing protein [Micromonospora sp. WMMD1082]